MNKLSLSILLILISTASSADCHFKNEKFAFFSDDQKKDRFLARVDGSDCNSATELIQIYNSNDVLIYEFSSKLSDGFKDKVTIENAKYVVKLVLNEREFGSTKNLPMWVPSDADYPHENYPKIPKEHYETLKTHSRPTFSHQVGYEAFSILVFDPVKQQVIEVTRVSP